MTVSSISSNGLEEGLARELVGYSLFSFSFIYTMYFTRYLLMLSRESDLSVS